MNTPKNTLNVKPRHLAIVQDILKSTCPHHDVWAYGSRVNSDPERFYDGVDLDLVVLGKTPPLYDLKNQFSNCNVPYLIDIVAMDYIPNHFKTEIQRKYTVVQTAQPESQSPTHTPNTEPLT